MIEKKKANQLPNIKLRYKAGELLKEFKKKYGQCNYCIDYALYPENNGISDMNNFWISKTISSISDQLNKIILYSQGNKEQLRQTLVAIISKDEGINLNSNEAKLLHALVLGNTKDVWVYLIHKGIQFSMREGDQTNIFKFVNDHIRGIIENLDLMISEEKEENIPQRNPDEQEQPRKSVTWVDRVTSSNKQEEAPHIIGNLI